MAGARTMILCAGAGTRLLPLTEECPKPLLPVGDRPLLRHILDYLAGWGISSAVVNTHHQAHAFESFDPGSVRLTLCHEPELLGTGGGVRHADQALEDVAVVWNGDIWAEPDLAALTALEALAAECGLALMVAAPKPGSPGTLGLNQHGQVVRLRGQTVGGEQRGADFTGIWAISHAFRQRLPQMGCVIGDFCIPYMLAGGRIPTLDYTGIWGDFGLSLSHYLDFNLAWLERTASSCWVHPSVKLKASQRVERGIVHQGAILRGSGALEQSIVFPGAVAELPLERALVTQTRVLQLRD